MSDAETLAVYNAKAQEYADRFTSGKPGASLRAFMELLPSGGAVLDLGCGPGHSAAHLVEAGFRVTASDASEAMVRLASAHPGVTARLAAFDDLDDVAVYDGIWANFSLLHAPRDRMDAHLHAIANALRPGGVFHIGLKTGVGHNRDHMGREYTFYTRDELVTRLENAGFAILSEDTGHEVGLAGTDDWWIVLRARLND